jgi:glycosyltransferase involved in cell wall biosynthesis
MRVLECLESANPADGGVVESTRQRCMALQRLGHQVELITQDDVANPWTRDWPTEARALGRGVTRYGFNPRVDEWVKENARRFDAVIVNSVWRYLGYGVRNGLRNTTVPYFVVPHSSLNPWFQISPSFKSISKIATWRLIEWRVLRDARCVLYTCEEERRLARTTYRPYACNEDVISLVGTSVPSTSETIPAEMFLSWFPHLRGKRLLLYLSRIHPMKGCDLLIEAFSRVCEEDPTLHLVIAGPADNGFADTLRQIAKRRLIQDRITWTGPLYKEIKWAAFRSASLFALPSHCEAYPVALLEALGSGLPALITDKVNIWSDVAKAEAGFLDSDTVDGTVRSLRMWLRMSSTEQFAMRRNALTCFSQRFEAHSNAIGFVDGLRRHGVCRDS